jgi:hypothetical protein
MAASAMALLMVACGGGTSAAGSAAGPATGGGPGFSGGGPGGAIVAGTVSSVSGDTVTVTTSSGDDQFQLSASTTILKVESATESDLVQGEFALVRGQRNQDGTVTATSVQVGQQPQGGFGAGSQFGGRGGGPGFGSARPSRAPRRSPGAGNGGTVTGTIAAVGGGTLTITTNGGSDTVVQVPASASILAAVSASIADITSGQTILARGQRDANGMLSAASVQVGP